MSGQCPSCGATAEAPSSSWKMKGNNQNKVLIEQYHCPKCGKAFRKGVPQT